MLLYINNNILRFEIDYIYNGKSAGLSGKSIKYMYNQKILPLSMSIKDENIIGKNTLSKAQEAIIIPYLRYKFNVSSDGSGYPIKFSNEELKNISYGNIPNNTVCFHVADVNILSKNVSGTSYLSINDMVSSSENIKSYSMSYTLTYLDSGVKNLDELKVLLTEQSYIYDGNDIYSITSIDVQEKFEKAVIINVSATKMSLGDIESTYSISPREGLLNEYDRRIDGLRNAKSFKPQLYEYRMFLQNNMLSMQTGLAEIMAAENSSTVYNGLQSLFNVLSKKVTTLDEGEYSKILNFNLAKRNLSLLKAMMSLGVEGADQSATFQLFGKTNNTTDDAANMIRTYFVDPEEYFKDIHNPIDSEIYGKLFIKITSESGEIHEYKYDTQPIKLEGVYNNAVWKSEGTIEDKKIESLYEYICMIIDTVNVGSAILNYITQEQYEELITGLCQDIYKKLLLIKSLLVMNRTYDSGIYKIYANNDYHGIHEIRNAYYDYDINKYDYIAPLRIRDTKDPANEDSLNKLMIENKMVILLNEKVVKENSLYNSEIYSFNVLTTIKKISIEDDRAYIHIDGDNDGDGALKAIISLLRSGVNNFVIKNDSICIIGNNKNNINYLEYINKNNKHSPSNKLEVSTNQIIYTVGKINSIFATQNYKSEKIFYIYMNKDIVDSLIGEKLTFFIKQAFIGKQSVFLHIKKKDGKILPNSYKYENNMLDPIDITNKFDENAVPIYLNISCIKDNFEFEIKRNYSDNLQYQYCDMKVNEAYDICEDSDQVNKKNELKKIQNYNNLLQYNNKRIIDTNNNEYHVKDMPRFNKKHAIRFKFEQNIEEIEPSIFLTGNTILDCLGDTVKDTSIYDSNAGRYIEFVEDFDSMIYTGVNSNNTIKTSSFYKTFFSDIFTDAFKNIENIIAKNNSKYTLNLKDDIIIPFQTDITNENILTIIDKDRTTFPKFSDKCIDGEYVERDIISMSSLEAFSEICLLNNKIIVKNGRETYSIEDTVSILLRYPASGYIVLLTPEFSYLEISNSKVGYTKITSVQDLYDIYIKDQNILSNINVNFITSKPYNTVMVLANNLKEIDNSIFAKELTNTISLSF